VGQGTPDARTEVPDPGLADQGEKTASEPPLFFTAVLWVGAFFTLVWGFRVLFMRLTGAGRPIAAEQAASGEADDVTLEDPGPDRS
jgi:hypothetical protein